MNLAHQFQVEIYTSLTQINSLISKARVRIFYKGLTRNRTYISEEIAEMLVNSLSYVPIKGIYDGDDFTDHGEERTDGKVYGVVPSFADCNFAWEDHEDDDGEIRTYACCDVYLWTGLFTEASEIINKPQSMELNEATMRGTYMEENGVKYYKYTHAEFLGLQVLGEDVMPCFEGAAFYSLINDVHKLMQLIDNYNKIDGGESMKVLFALSHEGVYSQLYSAVNSKTDEQGYRIHEYSVGPVFDTYAITTNYENGTIQKVNYTVENEQIVLGEAEEIFSVYVSKEELDALEMLKKINGGTFSAIDVKHQEITDSLETFKTDLNTAQADCTTTKTKLEESKTEFSTLEKKYNDLNTQYTALMTENEEFKQFKLDQEMEQKEAIVEKYSLTLDEEVVTPFKEKLDTYTVESLNAALAVLYVEAQEKLSTFNFVPMGGPDSQSGVTLLIDKHKEG